MLLDRQGRCLTTNKPGLQMLKTSEDEMEGRYFHDLWPAEFHSTIDVHIRQVLEGKQSYFEVYRMTGATKSWWSIILNPVYDDNGQVVRSIVISNDITEKKHDKEEKEKLHEQLQQAQKMESIGRLAGGIAHDFNNILTAIIGYSEIGLLSSSISDSIKEKFQVINESGRRAASLTEQLLLFSRKQILEMKDVKLDKIIVDMAKIINRLIGEDVSFEYKSKDVSSIWGDKGKLEQVIMNLAINARDAMPNGGFFRIEAEELTLDSDAVQQMHDLEPGNYIRIEAKDTGIGMSQETQDNIFEPFFTTKGLGKGTGLGLSTVYGIIKQHKGDISVSSELGEGTSFIIYLPVSKGKYVKKREKPLIDLPGGDETILVVEDEPNVRKFVVDVLDPLGYKLLGAASGEEALLVAHNHTGSIDLLLTDVIMPGMNGRELSDQLLEWQPELKTIYMSGYTDDAISHHGVLESGFVFINKPITPGSLAVSIRNVLDGTVN